MWLRVCVYSCVSDSRSLDWWGSGAGKSPPAVSVLGQRRPPQRGRFTCLNRSTHTHTHTHTHTQKHTQRGRINTVQWCQQSVTLNAGFKRPHSPFKEHVFIIFEVHSIYPKYVLFVRVWGQPECYVLMVGFHSVYLRGPAGQPSRPQAKFNLLLPPVSHSTAPSHLIMAACFWRDASGAPLSILFPLHRVNFFRVTRVTSKHNRHSYFPVSEAQDLTSVCRQYLVPKY